MPTSYHIINRSEFYELREASNLVISASPKIDWAIGLPMPHVRSYCERKGWTIIPIIEDNKSVMEFQYQQSSYHVFFNDRRITHIIKDGEEINWNELPNILKGLV